MSFMRDVFEKLGTVVLGPKTSVAQQKKLANTFQPVFNALIHLEKTDFDAIQGQLSMTFHIEYKDVTWTNIAKNVALNDNFGKKIETIVNGDDQLDRQTLRFINGQEISPQKFLETIMSPDFRAPNTADLISRLRTDSARPA